MHGIERLSVEEKRAYECLQLCAIDHITTTQPMQTNNPSSAIVAFHPSDF